MLCFGCRDLPIGSATGRPGNRDLCAESLQLCGGADQPVAAVRHDMGHLCVSPNPALQSVPIPA